MGVRMVHVGDKAEVPREAEAEAVLTGNPRVLRDLWEGKLPKGEARAAAQVAGTLAAKRTPELLPLCHPIRLDSIQVDLSLQEDRIVVRVKASGHDRTGVEMEALTGASIAALTLYDWAKSHDPGMEFTTRLVRKSGGKSGIWERSAKQGTVPVEALAGIRAAVVTVSDRASRGEYADESGAFVRQWLVAQGAEVVATGLVPDEYETISAEIARLTDTFQPDLLLTTGGTGFAPRDRTPEATRAVLEREAPGIVEYLRYRTGLGNARAYLSRATSGIRGRTLIINLPGGVRGVREHLEALLPILAHAVEMTRGGDHSHAG